MKQHNISLYTHSQCFVVVHPVHLCNAFDPLRLLLVELAG